MTPGTRHLHLLLATLVATLVIGWPTTATADSGYTVSGKSIKGGTDQAHARAIKTGTWRTTLPTPTSTTPQRWFRYHRTIKNSRIVVTTALYDTSSQDDSMELAILAATDEVCDRQTASDSSAAGLVTASATTTVSASSHPKCATASSLDISIDRRNDYDADQPKSPREVTIRIVEEPPVTSVKKLPSVATSAAPRPTLGSPKSITCAGSISDAKKIDEGTFSGSLSAGQVQIFRIHADWGQAVSAVLKPSQLPESVDGTLDVRVKIYAPTLADATLSSTSGYASSGYASAAGAATVPITYLNNQEYPDTIAAASLAGDYLVVISADDAPAGVSGQTTSYALAVALTGTKTDAPDYVGGASVVGSGDSSFPWLSVGLGVVGVALVGSAAAVLLWTVRRGRQASR